MFRVGVIPNEGWAYVAALILLLVKHRLNFFVIFFFEKKKKNFDNFEFFFLFSLSREQGDTKFDLGSTKIYFGEHQENNSGSREKRVKFRREPGVGGPTLWGLIRDLFA